MDLRGANLRPANLSGANLSEANLSGVDLGYSELDDADLRGANLRGADLSYARLIDTDLTGADLTGCRVFGISAWRLKLERAKQQNLIITQKSNWLNQPDEPHITVDNIEISQFIYLMLNNQKIRDVIDTITSKAVLILGRFIEQWIFNKASQGFRNTINAAILSGDGIGEPLGILHPSAGIPICETSLRKVRPATPLGQFTWQDLVALKYEVAAQYHPGAWYFMNQRTLGMLMTMSDASGRPLWGQLPGGFPGYQIAGSPIHIVTWMPDVAPLATPVAFGNWRGLRRRDPPGHDDAPRSLLRRLLRTFPIRSSRWGFDRLPTGIEIGRATL
jgi:hypothetical protein